MHCWPDLVAAVSEIHRVLKPGGRFQFSAGHPSFDAEYFETENYFSVEEVRATWSGFGIEVQMPSYRRSWEEALNPLVDAGFVLERLVEPRPTEQFRLADPDCYERLMHRPGFVCVRAFRPG